LRLALLVSVLLSSQLEGQRGGHASSAETRVEESKLYGSEPVRH